MKGRMIKKPLLFLVCFLTVVICSGNRDTLINVLEQNIQRRPLALKAKYQRINTLRKHLARAETQKDSFQLLLNLTHEYRSFNYDTASIEIQRLKKVAATPVENNQAEIQEAFILLSSGLFRESIDKLKGLTMEEMPDTVRCRYYFNLARSYFDLTDAYTNYLNTEEPFNAGMAFLDSAIYYTENNTVEQLSFLGLKALKRKELEKSKKIYQQLIQHPEITTRQLAIEYSALSSLYQGADQDTVLHFMIKAAIADEQALVKESTALTFLANYFSEAKNFERASRYINLALSDANFFGAQHRKMQILNILPLIEKQRLELEQSKYQQFVFFSATLAMLLFLSVLLFFRTLFQKKHIKSQHQQIIEREAAIQKAYQALATYAQKLSESNQLKEKYIGHFFQANTNLVNKVKSLFSKSSKEMAEGKFKEAIFTIKQFNADHEEKKLLQDFDSTFLTVFPTFIEQMNQFFPPAEQFEIPAQKVLSIELRIFALIRLGVSNNDIIAKVHNYSVNTIYTYKTKVRNRSFLSSDDFDKAVLEVKSIWNN
ncbi:DUF6377 domain-containing protein [Lewinella sp. LCG006]|uniref:DUF6377 domain-containing protein n=1 Tax=Lewinella sp. LCG006 TaxID=3231911 RepID=UPI0034601673